MQFPRDLLIIDIETTGSNPYIHKPFQIGAVLLDRQTLEEKKQFVSFIYQPKDVAVETLALQKVHIDFDRDLAVAPSIEEVAERFVKTFGFDVTIASWVIAFDVAFFTQMINAIGLQWGKEYDHHALDLFTLTWDYCSRLGWKTIPNSQEVFDYFKLPPRGFHDGLEDCRLEAEVLRRIVK